jgi:UDP-GlcNAc3NAcA epimerase
MLKLITIVGARPQIIKAAAISRAIKNKFASKIEEIIVHTGQHYDENMSEVFFKQLQIPNAKYNLHVGSASHGEQTARMIEGIEKILINEKADGIILYGDTNSTLAGAVAASKIEVPVIHIEAGLRSYNKNMPEEINRIMCDHVSSLLFSPTKSGIENLQKEGFKINNVAPFHKDNPGVFHCGDIMFDNTLFFSDIAKQDSHILSELEIQANAFILCTIHRNANTDSKENINAIFQALLDIAEKHNTKIVLPLHPRTHKMMETLLVSELSSKVKSSPNLKIIAPASFLDMLALEKNCKMVITDSGGVQKEAFFCHKYCLILRPETEWVELVNAGAAILADANYDRIINGANILLNQNSFIFDNYYGDGQAAEYICETIIKHIPNKI